MTDRYLSRRVAGLKPSGIRKFFDITATMKDVISLGIGEPDFTTPEPILLAGIESLQRGETHYTSNYGILELRRELAAHFATLYGVEYNPEKEIIITVGGSEALNLAAIALLNPGDEVIIFNDRFPVTDIASQLGTIPYEVLTSLSSRIKRVYLSE